MSLKLTANIAVLSIKFSLFFVFKEDGGPIKENTLTEVCQAKLDLFFFPIAVLQFCSSVGLY